MHRNKDRSTIIWLANMLTKRTHLPNPFNKPLWRMKSKKNKHTEPNQQAELSAKVIDKPTNSHNSARIFPIGGVMYIRIVQFFLIFRFFQTLKLSLFWWVCHAHSHARCYRWDKCDKFEMYQKQPSTNNRRREAKYQGRSGWKAPSKRKGIYIEDQRTQGGI